MYNSFTPSVALREKTFHQLVLGAPAGVSLNHPGPPVTSIFAHRYSMSNGLRGLMVGKPWENGDLYGQIHHFVAGKWHLMVV